MPASPATEKHGAREAFTIVELMVSISILALLVVLLAGVFTQVSRAWSHGEGDIERRRSARALTDYIGTELQAAMLPAEGGAVPPGRNNLQFVINPPQLPDDLRNADGIFWQAPLATETSFGEIAEIGYFVRWVAPNLEARKKGLTASRPVLCRFFVNPSIEDPKATPLEKVMIPNPNFLIYTGNNPNAWLTESLLNEIAPAKAPGYAGLFGENVLGFWVRAYGLGTDGKRRDNELPRTFYSLPRVANDTEVGYVYDRPYTDLNGKSATRKERYYLPAWVQISIVQVDSQHLHRLDAVWRQAQTLTRDPAIRDAGKFMERFAEAARGNALYRALLPGLRTYTTEVQLQNAR